MTWETEYRQVMKQIAKNRTIQANKKTSKIKNILKNSLSRDIIINWDVLKDNSEFSKPEPGTIEEYVYYPSDENPTIIGIKTNKKTQAKNKKKRFEDLVKYVKNYYIPCDEENLDSVDDHNWETENGTPLTEPFFLCSYTDKTEDIKYISESINKQVLSEVLKKAKIIQLSIIEEKPEKPNIIPIPPKPERIQSTIPRRPNNKDKTYKSKHSIIGVLPSMKKLAMKEAELIYRSDLVNWEENKEEIEQRNNIIDIENEKQWEELKKEIERENIEIEKKYNIKLKQYLKKRQECEEEEQQWKEEKQEFLNKQKTLNESIELERKNYTKKISSAILSYCKIVLLSSNLPISSTNNFDLDYVPESGLLVVDYQLPLIKHIPNLKEVKYIQIRDEMKKTFLSRSELNKLYDNLIYQIALKTIHELYKTDDVNALESIVFNGFVKSIDKRTGHEFTACIISIQANKSEIDSINLQNVNAKECFRFLKGVGSSKLYSITPIAPILRMNKEDNRFTSSYDVANDLDESYNIAAMDWKDFEHLIRELFEKEFSQAGGEVKVTQASRDGGVDAIAFDPDPIRGGKIVIQAKRYTNLVSVSAIRDLYGTVVNEGATKGILVSTSDYGPDAYAFAKGKPITLLNGGNLLHLLEKHGHKAKIDLKEAKIILAEREK